MRNGRKPFCSIIVLNYNGEKIIADTLNSLLSQDYPKNKFEIIIVDNHSQDNSLEILNDYSAKHTSIKVYPQNKNLGFSKGNNKGIEKSKGEYVALINNDCIVERDWLREIVAPAVKDKDIFAVNSKILQYPKFIKVIFRVDPKLNPVYTWLSKSALYNNSETGLTYLPLWRKPWGTYPAHHYFEIELLYHPYEDKTVEFTILLNSRGVKFNNRTNLKDLIVFDNNSLYITKAIRSGDDIEYRVRLDLSNQVVLKGSLDKIQNAGILVFQDGYGRDIGAVVRHSQQFYEYDFKQYEEEKEIYAACAAAVLYRRDILDKIGFLDESFFMYYEDVDICERARFSGFKTVYTPRAKVRHHHALTSKEWSPFFIYHVEKGRLLHLLYNFPFRVFIKEYFNLTFKSFVSILSVMFKFSTFLYNVKNKTTEGVEPKFIRRIQTLRALNFFIVQSPILFLKRIKYYKGRKRKEVMKNYLKILRGDWYFS